MHASLLFYDSIPRQFFNSTPTFRNGVKGFIKSNLIFCRIWKAFYEFSTKTKCKQCDSKTYLSNNFTYFNQSQDSSAISTLKLFCDLVCLIWIMKTEVLKNSFWIFWYVVDLWIEIRINWFWLLCVLVPNNFNLKKEV